ncbi:hypothetical protein [Streptomyces flavofungini]|uniref:hypothetical protein n=1 Tax=Streptomyces flavofungini TaxID=68200 RepID=UPI0025AEEB86|nr:hypothetical protein [Streptomyces flavofungini]WJV51732.1 hypothetical protein QUY26_39580 [Streptomyces flavofungini]
MPEIAPDELPFRVGYDMDSGAIIVWMTFGAGPRQTTRRKVYTSLEATVIAVAEHQHESFLQARLANELAHAAITHLGADPKRLQAAVRALSDPASTVPVGAILRGDSRP